MKKLITVLTLFFSISTLATQFEVTFSIPKNGAKKRYRTFYSKSNFSFNLKSRYLTTVSGSSSSLHEDTFSIEAESKEEAFKKALNECLDEHSLFGKACNLVEIKQDGISLPMNKYKLSFKVNNDHIDSYTVVSTSKEDAYAVGMMQCQKSHTLSDPTECKLERMTIIKSEPINVKHFLDNMVMDDVY